MDDREAAAMLESAGWRHLNNDPAWVKNLGSGVLTIIGLGLKEYRAFGPLSDLPRFLSPSLTAVPDLLEALVNIRDTVRKLVYVPVIGDLAEALAQVDAAIAKARGDTP